MITPPDLETICDLNPSIHRHVLAVLLDAIKLYGEASENIGKNGAITGHPKTGAPIVNPYLPIRDMASKTICQFHKEHPGAEIPESFAGEDSESLLDSLYTELDAGPVKGRKRATKTKGARKPKSGA